MEYKVHLHGKDLIIKLSKSAIRALQDRTAPLHVEMELHFSCLTRMRVHFDRPVVRGVSAQVGESLILSFRPVMGHICSFDDVDPDTLHDLPANEAGRFSPRWLNLDFRRGQWQGKFGYQGG